MNGYDRSSLQVRYLDRNKWMDRRCRYWIDKLSKALDMQSFMMIDGCNKDLERWMIMNNHQ